MKSLAYGSSEAFKAAVVAEMRRHVELETLIPGEYWKSGKGCFIGCIIHSDNHAAAMKKIGAPLRLGHLCERTFEGCCRSSLADGHKFAIELLEAIPAGADLSAVPDRIMVKILSHLLDFKPVAESEKALKAVSMVRDLYQRTVDRDLPKGSEWICADEYCEASAHAAARDGNAARTAVAIARYLTFSITKLSWIDEGKIDGGLEASEVKALSIDDGADVAAYAGRIVNRDNARALFYKKIAADLIRECRESPIGAC